MRINPNSIKQMLQHLVAGFGSTPLPCRICYGFILSGLLITLLAVFSDSLPSAVVILTVVPFRLLPPNFWIWTLGTFWLVETNLVLLACHVVCIHVSGAVLHSVWGWREWARYFCLVNVGSALSTVAVMSVMYMLTKTESWYFSGAFPSSEQIRSVRGLSGFDGAVLVAVKQALPDTVVLQTPWLGRYKSSHFPFTAMLIGVVVTAVGLLSPVYFVQFLLGSYIGWVYLRFYQKHPNQGSPRGDPNDNFSFASFFPSIIQPPISMVGGACYRAAVRVGLCQPAVRRFVDLSCASGSLQSVVTASSLSSNQADAERRRQKALRDLNERLARARDQSTVASAWPSLIDDEEEEGGEGGSTQPVAHTLSVGSVEQPVRSSPSSVSAKTAQEASESQATDV